MVNAKMGGFIVQLLKHKCLPILLYALDVCNLDKRMRFHGEHILN